MNAYTHYLSLGVLTFDDYLDDPFNIALLELNPSTIAGLESMAQFSEAIKNSPEDAIRKHVPNLLEWFYYNFNLCESVIMPGGEELEGGRWPFIISVQDVDLAFNESEFKVFVPMLRAWTDQPGIFILNGYYKHTDVKFETVDFDLIQLKIALEAAQNAEGTKEYLITPL